MLLRDDDISAELPAEVDDENLTSQGFSPTLPGEITKISSALALFRVSKILSKALNNLYPAKATYQLSLNKLHALSDELDQWSEELPEHLRLRFMNDKPATHLISDRSPLLVSMQNFSSVLSSDFFLVHRLFLHAQSDPQAVALPQLRKCCFRCQHRACRSRQAHLPDY